MANFLDRFSKTVVGIKNKVADYVPTISPQGDFKRVTNLDAILLSWNNILLTPLRTYTFDPDYGCDLYKMIFEQADQTTIDRIKTEVLSKLQYYDDRAKIVSIDVQFLTNKKGFTISILLEYNGEQSNLGLTLDSSTYFRFMEIAE
jgi:phage baseplate assembly protein W